ncbi:MAG TPA: translocation/assembly module TamB domain-containing protein, partial [Candidatus Kapabacteria bacterium]|nr:translocation/assembly module TamB domain-containing protein [Candidatus Kapabacteria bacterium]
MFRRLIVSELVSTIEKSTNGTLEVESLSGDLINGFVLRNVHLKLKTASAYDSIDILHAERVFVRYDIFKLVKATELGARSIIIERPTINLVKFEGDTLYNHQLLFKPVAKNQPPPQPFTQIVRLEALRIIDGNVRVRDYNKRTERIQYVRGGSGAEKKEKDIDWGDLMVEDLDLDGHLFARGGSAVAARIDHLRFSDRTSGFFVHHVGFSAYSDSLQLRIDNADIITGHSNVMFSLEVAPPSVLQTGLFESLEKSGTSLHLRGPRISTYELRQFLPSLGFLGGSPGIDLVVDGEFGKLNVRKLELDFKGKGDIAIDGRLDNLHDPDQFFMDLHLSARSLSNSTVQTYVPGLEIPNLSSLGTVNIPSLTYVGTPYKFATALDVRTTGAGNARGDVALDIRTRILGYKADLTTQKLDFGAIIADPSIKTDLTATIKIDGRGTDYRTLTSTFDIQTKAPSSAMGYAFTYFNGRGVVDRGRAIIDDMHFNMIDGPLVDIAEAQIDFARENPAYTFNGSVRDLRLARFMRGFPNKQMLISFDANVNGIGTDLATVSGTVDARIHNLYLAGQPMRDIHANITLAPRGGFNSLQLNSEIADISIDGRFRLSDLTTAIPQRITAITTAISKRYFPEPGDAGSPLLQKTAACGDSVDIDFAIRAKDLRPLSAIFPRMTLLASGNLDGQVIGCSSRDLNIYAATDSLTLLLRERGGKVDTLLSYSMDIDTTMFLSDSIKAMKAADSTALPRIHMTPTRMSLTMENMITDPTTVLDSLIFAFKFKDSLARFNSMLFTSPSVELEYRNQAFNYDISTWFNNKFRFRADGHADFPQGDLSLFIDTLDFQLKDQRPMEARGNRQADIPYIWHNTEPVEITLGQDGSIEIDTFGMRKEGLGRDESRDHVSLAARIRKDTIDYAFVDVPTLTVSELISILPPSNKTYKLEEVSGTLLGLRATMSNTLAKPEIDVQASLNNIRYQELAFDSTNFHLRYIDQALRGDVYLKIDTGSVPLGDFASIQIPWNNVLVARIDSIPMLISFAKYPGYSADSAAVLKRPLSAGLTTRNFPIDILSPFLPMFTTITGIGNIGLSISGTQENIDYSGSADIDNGGFLLGANNVYYTFDGGVEFNRDRLDLRDIVVRNTPADDPNGQATISGGLDLKGFSVQNFDIGLTSDRITVLTNASIASLKNIYGPLAISTQGNPLTFTGSPNSPKLAGRLNGDSSRESGTVEILQARLTYQNESRGRRARTGGIQYRYIIGDSVVSDSTFTAPLEMRQALLRDTARWTPADSLLWPDWDENIMLDNNYSYADSMVAQIQAKRFKDQTIIKPTSSFADRMQYDLLLSVPGDAWIVTHLASTLGVLGERLQAELKTRNEPLHIFKGPNIGLTLNGTINITDQSTYRMYKTFTISRGDITFTGDPKNPTIDITAEHSGTDAENMAVTVQINLSNTLEDPK